MQNPSASPTTQEICRRCMQHPQKLKYGEFDYLSGISILKKIPRLDELMVDDIANRLDATISSGQHDAG